MNDVLDSRAFRIHDRQAQLAAYDDAEQRRQELFKQLRSAQQ